MTRFTFHQPQAHLKGTAPALREVREQGQAIGLLNRTEGGYALRDLDGKLLDTYPVADQAAAAGYLATLQEAAYRVASGSWTQAEADHYTGRTSPQAEAQAALEATDTRELLTKAYHLTHRIHTAELATTPAERRLDAAAAEALRDLRAQRELITAEVLRRTGGH